MLRIKIFPSTAAMLLLLHHAGAQQNCINTCTDSANVLTQLKSCNGCGTDDWACFCRCQQYITALVSCAKQYCTGSEITDSIVSFCDNQGVTLSYISTATSPSTSSSSSITSDAAFSTTAASSRTSFTATDTSDLSSYLSSAVPAAARTESSSACFVNTEYSSYYSTPTWYSSLPTQVQSYYSSVNQGNTAACTLSPAQAAAVAKTKHGGSGLSAGAIAGIVIGAILATLLLAALLWCCLRRRRRAHRDAAAYGNEKNGMVEPRAATYGQSRSQAPYRGDKAGLNGASATPASNHMAPVIGGAGFVSNNEKDPLTHTTTTTTRTTIRSRPKKPANVPPPSQPTRPPPQPIVNHANAINNNNNSPPQSIPRKPVGWRAF